ncbi:hypothetical protein OE749_12430 [Aestuariibacter sp. AA17]|uniref:Tox-URI2 domain-containing protein n=1 Tax=Fluctibacter corallii TaxID=2984329 RepID=A0ABT3AB37_9ALTE|nr:hypothetical protein [Aestuariibacter sp. AA17]MCV2885502.1 hypothetical protein [Aestuariibacter sp. AA17]
MATNGGDNASPLNIGSGILLGMLPAAPALKIMRLSNKRKKVHGNSKNSGKRQHLYRIDDVQDFDIYKYGISGGALNKNGSSKRANAQVNKLNKKVRAKRYVSVVMFSDLPNRLAALAAEKALVCAYYKANGHNPEGNKRPTCY